MQRVVVSPVDKWLAGAEQGCRVDRDHHRPFEALGAMDGDDLDGVSVGINATFVISRAIAPISAQVVGKALYAFDAVGPSPFEQRLDVGGGARAAIAFARAEDRAHRQP